MNIWKYIKQLKSFFLYLVKSKLEIVQCKRWEQQVLNEKTNLVFFILKQSVVLASIKNDKNISFASSAMFIYRLKQLVVFKRAKSHPVLVENDQLRGQRP